MPTSRGLATSIGASVEGLRDLLVIGADPLGGEGDVRRAERERIGDLGDAVDPPPYLVRRAEDGELLDHLVRARSEHRRLVLRSRRLGDRLRFLPETVGREVFLVLRVERIEDDRPARIVDRLFPIAARNDVEPNVEVEVGAPPPRLVEALLQVWRDALEDPLL